MLDHWAIPSMHTVFDCLLSLEINCSGFYKINSLNLSISHHHRHQSPGFILGRDWVPVIGCLYRFTVQSLCDGAPLILKGGRQYVRRLLVVTCCTSPWSGPFIAAGPAPLPQPLTSTSIYINHLTILHCVLGLPLLKVSRIWPQIFSFEHPDDFMKCFQISLVSVRQRQSA